MSTSTPSYQPGTPSTQPPRNGTTVATQTPAGNGNIPKGTNSLPSNAVASSSRLPQNQYAPSSQRGVDMNRQLSNKALGKRKRTDEELEIVSKAEAKLKANLLLDQSLTTSGYIPAESFASAQDVVDRLLPWHIWQVHDRDLDCFPKDPTRKKRELKVVEDIVNRKNQLEGRLLALAKKASTRPTSQETSLQFSHFTLTQTREDLASTMSSLKDARQEQEELSAAQKKKMEEIQRMEESRKPQNQNQNQNYGQGQNQNQNQNHGQGQNQGAPQNQNQHQNQKQNQKSQPSSSSTPTTTTTAATAEHNRRRDEEIRRRQMMAQQQAQASGGAQPVLVNVPIALIPQLTALNIIPTPPTTLTTLNKPSQPPPGPSPGFLLKMTEDKKSAVVSVVVSSCNPQQLSFLAKMLQGKAT